ncbi:hypothetical protein TNCT_657241 [Trichonephila clavata]|uniref:Uncharacterized protein n=1 Tax=Trichonephila clavata TaxID=2740835 RepID=A0A8X6GXR3_TRICU|nr:hypothetical protein TNCT_657241 [Trichonephila clavata]
MTSMEWSMCGTSSTKPLIHYATKIVQTGDNEITVQEAFSLYTLVVPLETSFNASTYHYIIDVVVGAVHPFMAIMFPGDYCYFHLPLGLNS